MRDFARWRRWDKSVPPRWEKQRANTNGWCHSLMSMLVLVATLKCCSRRLCHGLSAMRIEAVLLLVLHPALIELLELIVRDHAIVF